MGKQTAPVEAIQTSRDANGVPPIVGLGDGVVTGEGRFVPEQAAGKPDFAAKLRAVQAEQQQIVRLPDGSARVNVVIEAEMMPVLEEWANGAGETFEEYLPKMISMGLEAIVLGGSVAG